jgi:hypothetical protein
MKVGGWILPMLNYVRDNRMSMIFPKWMIMVFVLVLIFGYNIDGVNRYTIRRDELTTLGHIGALVKNTHEFTITDTIASLSFYSSDHAPAYYIFANIWGHVVDFNYFALRMLSVWFGMITVAATYRIGHSIISHTTGFYAAIILGTNIVFYANFHEMREWSMMLMLSTLNLALYWHLAHKPKSSMPLELIVLFFSVVISLYTSYLTIFMLLAIGLYHLLVMPKNKRWGQISATVIVAGFFFIPWLPVVIDGVLETQDKLDMNSRLLINNTELIQLIPVFWGNGSVALFVGVMGLGFFSSLAGWRRTRSILFFLIVITIGYLFFNEALSFIKRIRYLLLWLLPFALFSGTGLALLAYQKILHILLFVFIGMWVVSGFYFIPTDQFNIYLAKSRPVNYPEYSGLVPLLREQTEKRDLLVLAQYESSALNKSKQGLSSIQDFFLNPLKLTITNFPQYSQWAGSGIDADSVEYALGLVPGRDEFWLSYHHTQVTDDIIRFRERVEQDFHIYKESSYGERSILIHYVAWFKTPES